MLAGIMVVGATFRSALKARLREALRDVLDIREIFEHWWRTKPGMVAYLGDHRALVRTTYDRYLFVDTRDMSLSPQLALHGHWEPGVTTLLRRLLKPGMTMLEVGANYGYFSLLAASLVGEGGRVRCLEPNPQVARLLRQSIEINGFSRQVAVVEKAAWSSAAELEFFVLAEHMGSSSANASAARIAEAFKDQAKCIKIQSVPLDEFAADFTPDVLKIDAEGAELQVILGARGLLERNPGIRVVMEFYPANFADAEDPGRLLDLLQSLGLRWQAIDANDPLAAPAEMSRARLLEARTTELLLHRNAIGA